MKSSRNTNRLQKGDNDERQTQLKQSIGTGNIKQSPASYASRKKRYHYAVNLRLNPVESGITCQSTRRHRHTFTGLGAFNFYFDYLIPHADGFSLPDVWDGYFHITLAEFDLNVSDVKDCQKKEQSLADYIKNHSEGEEHDRRDVFPCRFHTTELSVHSGSHRRDERAGVDFVTLSVQDQDGVWDQLEPLLRIIQSGIEEVQGELERPIEDYHNRLHVTVRKYPEESERWSNDYIYNSGVLQRVLQCPLSFDCVSLQIVPSRRDAVLREDQWWIGVTGIDLPCPTCGKNYSDRSLGYCSKCRTYGANHQCSGCGRRESRFGRKWQGFCPGCWEYERLKPIWSTSN